MKRGFIIFVFLLVSLSFISAFSISDLFSGITGNAISPSSNSDLSNSFGENSNCVNACLEKTCGNFVLARKNACMNADFRIKSCESECESISSEGGVDGNASAEVNTGSDDEMETDTNPIYSIDSNSSPDVSIRTNNLSFECNFYNEQIFEDTLGDTTPEAPNYVDIKSLVIRQIGDQVQFIWEGSGPLENEDNQFYFVFLDTDFNPDTGQRWASVGGEIKIGISHAATIGYFDQSGNMVNEIHDLPVAFEGNKFYLNIPFSYVNSNHFNLYFETSGGTPWKDEGSVNEVNLQRVQQPIKLIIGADEMILKNNPALVTVERGEIRQLKPYVVQGATKTAISQENIIYKINHPVGDRDYRIGDLSEIVSVSSNGRVKYEQRPGFIFVNGLMEECGLTTEKPLVIATGTVYGNPSKDNVLAIFPKDYATRESGRRTFGEMFRDYPSAMWLWNLGYNLSSKMYGNYKPFDGDKQIFVLDVSIDHDLEFACGNMNPLESDPTCYMDSEGKPDYWLTIHEMGHNFGYSKGMAQFVFADNGRMNRGGECLASLPVIYMYADFTKHPEKYGINRNSYEYNYFKSKLEGDIPTILPVFNDFENQIRTGQISGYFDEDADFDKVQVFCDFFQLYAYNLTDDVNPYKQEVISRWLRIFSDRELPNFVESKSETYFAASYSAAIGHDMRDKLRFWGFNIDNGYFNEIYPKLLREVNNYPRAQINPDISPQQRPTVFARIRNIFRRN